ncbi:hypothetical protein [uncultured Treponema sp.]|uniref:hypothetical protein n=1 Tax=uncultured Treponema sp. TaxID=162155 RepID=UPI0025E6D8DD|nr:hypothetical protein [uncultured Treponema sp.]
MSRSDRRRGGRNQSWSNRENNEKNSRSEPKKQEVKSERKHESRGSASYERRQERRRYAASSVNQKEIEENQNAIRAFKEKVISCEICGEPINDIANAFPNKESGNPVHFDCVLAKITESEKISSTEKIAYIGQGKFAVLYFANPHDQKHFSIRRTIEWESRENTRGEWRDEMAGLYSQVK